MILIANLRKNVNDFDMLLFLNMHNHVIKDLRVNF